MKLHLEFAMDNAAMQTGEQAGYVLDQLSDKIFEKSRADLLALAPHQCPLRDENGNYIGFWQVTP